MADTYTVERTTTIQAPPERVYGLVHDFHHWPAWSPWEDVDPDMDKTYSGPEAGTGAVYEWSGNRKAGKGRMEIKQATEASLVDIALDFEKPFRSSNQTTFRFEPTGDATTVTWTMVGPRPLLLKVMGVFMSMEKMVGSDFEKGLARLKTAAERPA